MFSATIPNRIFTTISLTLNSFLLQLIVRKSSKELSLYKYLLFIFILNDIIYTVLHFITRPVISIHGEVFYLFSTNYAGRWPISIFGTSHSHSFLILGFHFVYRHIAVTRHNGANLFRQWWFISIFVAIFIAETVIWFLLVFYLYATDQDTFLTLSDLLVDYPEIDADSLMTAHYWKPDGGLRWRPLAGTAGLSILMTIVLIIVIYSAASIFKVLHNNLSKSRRGLALQRQLYNTLLVQFSVPFFVMYVPVIFAILPPLFHIRLSFPNELMPTMFSIYPSLDALVILFGVHDYRKAVLAGFRSLHPMQLNGVVSFTTDVHGVVSFNRNVHKRLPRTV